MTEVGEDWGLVPCGICGKWVRSDIETKDASGAVVHPPCLNRECDFCTNPEKLPVGLYWDIEKDEDMFMCESCKGKRRIDVVPEYLLPKERP